MAGTSGDKDPIGLKIRELRTARRLTQRALAAEAGITAMALSRIELGSRLPSPQTIRALARVLGVDPGVLFRAPLRSAREGPRVGRPRKAVPGERATRSRRRNGHG